MVRKIVLWLLLAVLVLGTGSAGLAAPSSPAVIRSVGLNFVCYPSIEAAIADANPGDTIRVQDSLFTENPLTVDKNLTLEGGYPAGAGFNCLASTATGKTVVQRTGMTDARILTVTRADVSIKDFDFEDNLNGGGISALFGSSLTLEDVYVADNKADWGGGLYIIDSTAVLTDCMFWNNEAGLDGGGINVWGSDPPSSVTLTRVYVEANEAGRNGGGIHVEGNATVTTGEWVLIDGNDAAGDGGGIHAIRDAQVTFNVSDNMVSYILQNHADGDGGGVYLKNAKLVLNGKAPPAAPDLLNVTSNTADNDHDNDGDGGGIYATGKASVEAHETHIGANEAYRGGGLYLSQSSFSAEDVYVNHNGATENGGGIWAGEVSTVTLSRGSQVSTRNDIQPNTAENGGGIYAEAGSQISLSNSEVRGNLATENGCGVYVTGGASFSATMSSTIELNAGQAMLVGVEGGGIYASGEGTQVLIDASSVTTNTAFSRGGGLFLVGGAQATIQNGSLVAVNQTKDLAGGGAGAWVAGPDTTLLVRDSDLIENGSGWNGGGIYNHRGTVQIDGARMIDNIAWQYGGGLYNDRGMVQVDRAEFYVNEANAMDGGGLYTTGQDGVVQIERSNFAGNEAPAGTGGAIGSDESRLSVQRTYLAINTAQGLGGAIHAAGTCCMDKPTVEVVNSFLVNNTAASLNTHGPPGNGSEIYIENAPAVLIHNTFAHQVKESFAVLLGDGAEVTMTNNILSNYIVGIRQPLGGTGTATASYTLYHNNTTDYDAAGVTSTSEVHGDPRFVGPLDLHLMEGSDAINAGTDAGVGIDFDGDVRPWDGGYEIGADEFGEQHRTFLPLISKEY